MRNDTGPDLRMWELEGNQLSDQDALGMVLEALTAATERDRPAWVLGADGERAAMIVPAADAQVIIDRNMALARGAVMVPFNRDKLISLLGWIGAHMREEEPEFFHDAILPMQQAVITTAQELERQRQRAG